MKLLCDFVGRRAGTQADRDMCEVPPYAICISTRILLPEDLRPSSIHRPLNSTDVCVCVVVVSCCVYFSGGAHGDGPMITPSHGSIADHLTWSDQIGWTITRRASGATLPDPAGRPAERERVRARE